MFPLRAMFDEDLPPPPRDGRLGALVHQREVRPATIRKRRRERELEYQESTRRGRARWATEILRDFGDPECPPATPPTAELFREARRALQWSQPEAAWRLGYPARTPYHIHLVETGQRVPPRWARLLLVRALQDLAAQQRAQRG